MLCDIRNGKVDRKNLQSNYFSPELQHTSGKQLQLCRFTCTFSDPNLNEYTFFVNNHVAYILPCLFKWKSFGLQHLLLGEYTAKLRENSV